MIRPAAGASWPVLFHCPAPRVRAVAATRVARGKTLQPTRSVVPGRSDGERLSEQVWQV